jgi:hypothetical protein
MRAEFHDFAVIVGGGVGEDGLRFGSAKSFIEIGVIEGWVEMKFCSVSIEENPVGFRNGYDLDFGAIQGMGEEAFGVAVNQARDGYAKRRFGVIRGYDDGECEGECA